MASTKVSGFPRTLGAAAFEHIRDMILSSELVPGTKINQPELAKRLGVSLVPIREALRKLEAEGFVYINPHRGAYVSPIFRDEIADLYNIRVALEGMATEDAIHRLKDDDFAKLDSLILEMEQLIQHGNAHELLRVNREFHMTIYRASGRVFLCNLIADLWEKSTRYRAAYVHLPGRSLQAHEEHKEILRALHTRSVDEAVSILKKNISQTMVGLLSAFDSGNRDEATAPGHIPGKQGPEH